MINRLVPVQTTTSPKPTTSRVIYQTTAYSDFFNKKNIKTTTTITPPTTTQHIKNNAVNTRVHNRQRVVFSDYNQNKKIERITTNQPTNDSRRNYIHQNTSTNHAISDYKQNVILKHFYEHKKNQSRSKELQQNLNTTTERKFITQNINVKNEPTTSSSTKWKYIDNFIPTTFKPTHHIKSKHIENIVNSTSPFINTNQINFKNKVNTNKKVSQAKSKNRQSKDYDYNYYEDISENVSPEYDFIEFKKLK